MVSLWHAFDVAAPVPAAEPAAAARGARAGASKAQQLWGAMRAELVDAATMRGREAAWRDLAERALLPNVFLEPEFALAATTHLGQAHPPRFLLLWDRRNPHAPRLILMAPLLAPAFGVGEAKLWAPEPMLSAVPLIDAELAEIAVDGLIEAVSTGPMHAASLLVPRVDEGSPFAALLRQSVGRSGRTLLRLEQKAQGAELEPSAELCAHDRTVTTRGARQVRDAVEQFLAIEALGPRGRSGEALLLTPSASAFVRVVTRSLARRRSCRVVLYLSQSQPVGADILLRNRQEWLLWKSATCEAPDQRRLPRAVVTDWLVAARPGRFPAMLALAARERLGRRLRELVRRAVVPR